MRLKFFNKSITENNSISKFATHLVLIEFDPEPGHGLLIRILRKQRVLWPTLFDVLQYYSGLCNGSPSMDKHRDLLVNWVEPQQFIALVAEIFLHILVFHPLELESPYNSVTEGTRTSSEQLDSLHPTLIRTMSSFFRVLICDGLDCDGLGSY